MEVRSVSTRRNKRLVSGQFTPCCLFCGRRWGEVSKSDEHVLGQWMRKHERELLATSHASYSSGFGFDDTAREFVELPTDIVTRKAALLTLKTREVCEDCNTGWMSKIEQSAEPLLRRLASAARGPLAVVLSRADARTLGLWAQKTAITYELTAHHPRVADVAMGKQLRSGQPLRGVIVWAARHPRDYDLSIALAHIEISATPVARPGPADRRVLLVAIVYHYMTLLVFIPSDPSQVPPPVQLDGWTLIWPAFTSVEYPPMRTVDGNELTRTLADHSGWLPMVYHAGIRRTSEPPTVKRRN
jgi:hypothetical protein